MEGGTNKGLIDICLKPCECQSGISAIFPISDGFYAGSRGKQHIDDYRYQLKG